MSGGGNLDPDVLMMDASSGKKSVGTDLDNLGVNLDDGIRGGHHDGVH